MLKPKPLTTERRFQVTQEIALASSPGFDFFLMTVMSATMATFGLITDSAAVVVGAMLVAPLMSPLFGLSLASVAGRRELFQRALLAAAHGSLVPIALATTLAWLASEMPFGAFVGEMPREIMLRTHPSPFDLVIALAGGAAGAYAMAQPSISPTLPGVAIAVALMPPLCTVGIGIAILRPDVWVGALLLFLTNFAAIWFAGIVVYVFLGFRPVYLESTHRELLVSAALVLVVTIPLAILSVRFVNETRFLRTVREAVAAEVQRFPDGRLIDLELEEQDGVLDLLVSVRASREPTHEEVVEVQEEVAKSVQRPVSLVMIVSRATRLDPLVPPTPDPTPTPSPTPTPTPTPSPTPTPAPEPTPEP